MQNNFFKLLLIVTLSLLLFLSCSTIKSNIKKNDNKTDKWVNYLVEKNGNAFYVTSSYSTHSTVWSYVNDQIMIYRLASGKILKVEKHTRKANFINEIPSSNDINSVLRNRCGYELDGDIFGYKIKKREKFIELSFPVNIECLKNGKYDSVFLSEITGDITNYNL